jgi:hypothetical protein
VLVCFFFSHLLSFFLTAVGAALTVSNTSSRLGRRQWMCSWESFMVWAIRLPAEESVRWPGCGDQLMTVASDLRGREG